MKKTTPVEQVLDKASAQMQRYVRSIAVKSRRPTKDLFQEYAFNASIFNMHIECADLDTVSLQEDEKKVSNMLLKYCLETKRLNATCSPKSLITVDYPTAGLVVKEYGRLVKAITPLVAKQQNLVF